MWHSKGALRELMVSWKRYRSFVLIFLLQEHLHSIVHGTFTIGCWNRQDVIVFSTSWSWCFGLKTTNMDRSPWQCVEAFPVALEVPELRCWMRRLSFGRGGVVGPASTGLVTPETFPYPPSVIHVPCEQWWTETVFPAALVSQVFYEFWVWSKFFFHKQLAKLCSLTQHPLTSFK